MVVVRPIYLNLNRRHKELIKKRAEVDAAGTLLQRPNGLHTSYTYDAAGQLRIIDHTGIGLWQYSYDAVGNRTQRSTPTGTHVYTYDATDRLTSATHPTGPVETFGRCR